MAIKLSISGRDKFLACSMMYKYHYIDKLRPVRQSSALVFGSALDEALNNLLEKRNLDEAKATFWMNWSQWQFNEIIDFYNSDTDVTILSKETCEELDAIEDPRTKEHRAAWSSLYQKGLKLLDVYHAELLPSIKKVIAVQKEIALYGCDDEGKQTEDAITGIIDVIAEVEMDDGKIVTAVLDNKSTSTPYPKNSVEKKEQTALYTFAEGIEYGGFLTMNKKNFKTQKLIGVVPKQLQEETVETFVHVLERIKQKDFQMIPQNKCFHYGKRCDYYKYCWDNGDMRGLFVKPPTEDKSAPIIPEEE